MEEDAWAEVSQHYNSYRAEVLAEIDKLTSAKAKGKQRASGDDLDDWDVLQHDLPEYFRGSGNLDLARKIVSSEAGRDSSLSSRLGDLEYTVRCTSYSVLTYIYVLNPDRPVAFHHELCVRDNADIGN